MARNYSPDFIERVCKGIGMDWDNGEAWSSYNLKPHVTPKEHCRAKDPNNCPYHCTGKYALGAAKMDTSRVLDWAKAIFHENNDDHDLNWDGLKLDVINAKKGVLNLTLPYSSNKDREFKFDIIKANLTHNGIGAKQHNLVKFDKDTMDMMVPIRVKGFTVAAKAEEDMEGADKNKGKAKNAAPKGKTVTKVVAGRRITKAVGAKPTAKKGAKPYAGKTVTKVVGGRRITKAVTGNQPKARPTAPQKKPAQNATQSAVNKAIAGAKVAHILGKRRK